MKAFVITNDKEDPTAGMYATTDNYGNTIIQLFLDRDDAISYNIHLEAIGMELYVVGIEDGDSIRQLCEMMGHGTTTINKGEVTVPRIETLKTDLLLRSEPS